MNDLKFKTEVFDRINESYRLLKMIKDCGPHDSEDIWTKWVEASDNFIQSIDDERMRSTFSRFLMDMGDCIANLNRGEKRAAG